MTDERTYKIIGAAMEVQSADYAPEKYASHFTGQGD
jgi:hypothetical protein